MLKRALFVSLGLVACLQSITQAEMVTWTVDSAQSWVRLSIPDQLIVVGENQVNAWLRSAPSTFDPSNVNSPPVAGDWADNRGRLTSIQGSVTTDYVEGKSIQFAFGDDTLSLTEQGDFVPNRNFYTPGPPEAYNTHTLPPNGNPACFAFDLALSGVLRIAPCAIWGLNFDANGLINLSGEGPWTQSGGELVIGGEAGANLDVWAHGFLTQATRVIIGTTQGPNGGTVTIEDEGNGVRKMTVTINCFFTVNIGGLPLQNSNFTGQMVAYANISQPAQVVNSYVYHGGFGLIPDDRIDTGKVVAKEGSGPTFLSYSNLINTSRGINGLVFDIQDLRNGKELGPDDFEVQISPTDDFNPMKNPPEDWPTLGTAPTLTVTPGSPDRVRIEWPNFTIMNRWLRLTIKANDRTGLATPETYYLGHLLGETTGLSGSFYSVSFADVSPIRSDIGLIVDANSTTDIDKSGSVTFADISAMRANVGKLLTNIIIP